MRAIAFLIASLVAAAVWAEASKISVQLIPQPKAAPAATLDALAAHVWSHAAPRDILGGGFEQILEFNRNGDDFTLKVTQRHWNRINRQGPRFEDQTATHDCVVAGPILCYGETQQTFVLADDQLILQAVVPLGSNRWYWSGSRNWGKGERRDEEMLLEFAADPLKQDQGKGTLKVRSGDGGQVAETPIEFTLTRADEMGRRIQVTASDPNHAKRADLLFAPDGKSARLLDRPLASRVFKPAKADNAGQ